MKFKPFFKITSWINFHVHGKLKKRDSHFKNYGTNDDKHFKVIKFKNAIIFKAYLTKYP